MCPAQMEQPASQGVNVHPLAESLITWFKENGGQVSPDVQLVYSHAQGFHMRALRPLGSPVVASCPLKLTLSILNLDSDEKDVLHIESPLQKCRGKIPDHILTYLLLIEQRKKSKESPWHAYISCLPGPEAMGTPLWFDDDDIAFLAGTSLAPAAKERKAELHQQWEHAVAVMKDLDIPLANTVNLESLQWAATIFTSRAFISTHILPGRETIPMLFPVVDILNHSVSAKVEWDFQPHQSFALKCLEGDSIQPGQELFNNYAPKQNDELLLGYGFCLENNPIEQFALKLAFQPQLQQYAQQLGLLDAENVPFGMSKDFLATDLNREQHFLRAKGHPFGRYDNHTPFFRGVPSYIVHFFFIQTAITSELDINSIDVARPGARITLQVLVLLHQALEQRCSSLPLHIEQEPQNDRQKYAKIYRDGQARIIHSVRKELQAAVARLRTPNNEASSRTLHHMSDVVALFECDLPTAAKQFTNALPQHGLDKSQNETLEWTLLLTVLVSTMLTTQEATDPPIFALLRNLCARHALPKLEDGIEDVDTYTFVDENLGDFVHLPSADSNAAPSDALDDLGLTFVNQPAESDVPVFINGRTENLGARIIMWAMKVVEQDVVPVFEDAQIKQCLFTPTGDEWMYQDSDVKA
ncbi:set domain-containing protein [Stemphylium lycopersici]|nr:set domain-containing protein [Stemphylium lycopersici]RAR02523.1 set domain-containing protein [Stemphylium lycopersici]